MKTPNEQLSPIKAKHRRSKSSNFFPQESSDSSNIYRDQKNDYKRKKKNCPKKLKRIHFLSFSTQLKFVKNSEGGKKYLQFTPKPGKNKKKAIVNNTVSDNQREMKRSNSYAAMSLDKSPHKNSKDNCSVDCSPKKFMKRQGILKISKGGRKKMRIRSFAESLQGFDPTSSKPNQDRKLIHIFNIGSFKIRLFAVADGHGNFF